MSTSTGGVTIGQAAAFAGVTVKAVRHYHRLGLIDEPERDSSGYRRYGSEALLRLVQVRTLAGAGVPLAEIGAILDADPDLFADALADVERRLTDRIAELIERRDTLRQLSTGDRVLLPERAGSVLERYAELDFRPDYIAIQREALVLARAMAPELFESYLTQLEFRLDDPEYVDLTKRAWEAMSWDADDPRFDELATAMADNLLANRALLTMPTGFQARSDAATRYEMINHHGEDQIPIQDRLTALVEAKLRAAGIDVPYH